MRAMMIVLAVLVTLDAFLLTVFPEAVKRIVAELSARELQIAGAIESLLALGVVYLLVTGVP
ncbi:MAG: hypothetical protein ACYTFI_17140 [Planctomycetota bacterium]|jgi:uncharacterized protein YjeT (DUF2065 family)